MNSLTSLFTNWPKKLQKYKAKSESNFAINDKKCDKIKNWEDKAIDLLVKKLKEKPELLVLLEKVLEQKREDSPCIPILKTQDGRIQINRTKLFPHYVYCKLWRWPDLNQANEIKKLSDSYCSTSSFRKSNEVCVNPYHYERVSTNLFAASLKQQMFYNNQNSISNSLSSNDQSLIDEALNIQMVTEEQLNQSYYYTPDYNSPVSYSENNSLCSDFNYNINFNSSNSQAMNQDNYNSENYDTYMQLESTPPKQMNSDYQNNYQNNCQTNYQNKYQSNMPSNWCSIVYFRKKDRQGRHMIVDNQYLISGYNLRGYLNVNEGFEIKNSNGEVFIESCNCVMYIQSPFLNMMNNQSLDSVLKFNPLTPIKIFDENLFEDMIRRNYSMGYEALSDLIKFSKCTLSFNYGWGREFQNSTVLQSPFWLEITMDRALTVLDKPLSQLNASKQQVTSFS